jgi:D-glucuronyl C5-epimerase-like protein/PKD domain-containing protein
VLRPVGVLALAALAGAVAAAPANAAPSVSISASTTAGPAPLTVTFEASGDAVSYHWDLGNGETADGPTAGATYGPGLWTATVTATASDGTTSQASVTVRSVAITLLPPAESRYRRAAVFRGRVVPALAGEPVALYRGGRELATSQAKADGTFRLHLEHMRTPGPYRARTPVAASAPVTLRVHPVLRARFVGARAVGRRLTLAVRVLPGAAGTLSIRLYRDGTLLRKLRRGPTARVVVTTDRIADYRAVVRVQSTKGWLGAVRRPRAHVVCTGGASGGDGLVFTGGGQFQPLLSFAALNRQVKLRRCGAVRRLASALLGRAVRSGRAVFWNYDFSFEGGPVPWRSGFAQAVGAQALARAGVMLRDPALSAVAAASFRGLRRGLLLRLGGGLWIREYGFTHEVILNSQLQSILSLESYAAVAESAAARRVAHQLVAATRRLLPRFDLGCWARYQLGGGAASLHYQIYHVELLRRLAATHSAPIWRRTYLRWRRCL